MSEPKKMPPPMKKLAPPPAPKVGPKRKSSNNRRSPKRLPKVNKLKIVDGKVQRPAAAWQQKMPSVEPRMHRAEAVTKKGVAVTNVYEHRGALVSSLKPRARTTTTPGLKPCICGCGVLVPDYFKRGHIHRFNSALAMIAAGKVVPEKALGKGVAAALGPWKKNSLGGSVPTKTYRDLRD